MCALDCATIIVHGSERVTPGAERNDFGTRRNQPLKIAPIELPALRVHLRYVQSHAALLNQSLPRRHVGMMLEFGDENFIAWPERSSQSARQVINDRRRVGAEDDLICRRIQK